MKKKPVRHVSYQRPGTFLRGQSPHGPDVPKHREKPKGKKA